MYSYVTIKNTVVMIINTLQRINWQNTIVKIRYGIIRYLCDFLLYRTENVWIKNFVVKNGCGGDPLPTSLYHLNISNTKMCASNLYKKKKINCDYDTTSVGKSIDFLGYLFSFSSSICTRYCSKIARRQGVIFRREILKVITRIPMIPVKFLKIFF